MNPPLPPEIRVETSRQGVRYILPRRETGPLTIFSVVFIAFGCVFTVFAVVWMLYAGGLFQNADFQFSRLLFALFALPFLAVGLGMTALGVFAFAGTCEAEIRSGELLSRERGGPFWWTRRIPLKDIQRLTLASDAVRINGQLAKSGPMSDAGALSAEVGSGKPRLIVFGYPRAWLAALAGRLTEDITAQTGVAPLPTTVTQLDPATGRNVVSGDRFDPPAGTSVRISEQAGGIVVLVPATGFKGVSRFMLGFSAFWLLISTVVGGGFVAAALQGKGDKPPWFVFVLLVGFVLIGLGMLADALNLARRKASLRASRDELILLQQSLFGAKTFKWSRNELASIRVGDSGMAINDVPVPELQAHTTDGAKHGFFSNVTNDELLWLATHLRHATGVGEVPGESPEPPKLAK